MKRITGKIVKHQDGRDAYVVGRSKVPPYFEVIVLGGGREKWSAVDMEERSLLRALGLNKGEETSNGPDEKEVPSS